MMNNQEFKETFFKSKFTISVLINLLESKNRRFVVFKPAILFTSNDEDRINYIKEKLKLQTKVSVTKKNKTRPNIRYNLQVQNFDEIRLIIDEYFKGNVEEKRLLIFSKCLDKIIDIGYIQKDGWKDEFSEIIDLKMQLNNNRKRFSAKEWEEKIKKHLSGFDS